MPRGPKGVHRPVEVIGAAIMAAKIATGEIADDGKDKAAVAMGKKGGAARAASLSKKRRSEIARYAAKKRWKG
jgi:hypothetical protein